jgi:segregation and condensation protein B
MKLEAYERKIEAVLFACGESVEISRIARAFELEEEVVVAAIKNLQEFYERENRGLRVIFLEDKVQMVSNPAFYDDVQKVVQHRSKTKLSPAALEVLAIIAYNQPVTKYAIEKIRGADSAYPLSRLIASGLVAEAGRLPTPGRPILYRTTEDFLRCFSISSLDELPDISGFGPEKESSAG